MKKKVLRYINSSFYLLLHLFLIVPTLTIGAETGKTICISVSGNNNAVLTAHLPAHLTGRAVLYCPATVTTEDTEESSGLRNFFASRGIAFFTLSYGSVEGDAKRFAADARRAMRIIRDSAAVWHVNPDDIGVIGDEAGAFVVASLCTDAPWIERPDFAIMRSPILSMDERDRMRRASLNAFCDRNFPATTPLHNRLPFVVRSHLTPPTIIFAANDDAAISPVNNAVAYYTAMRKAGNQCAICIFPQGGREFYRNAASASQKEMHEMLSTWIDSLPAPQLGAVRVACIGNSITDGMGIDLSDVNSYPARLQQLLGERFYVRNFGVSARTLLKRGDRPYMNEQAWRDAQHFAPDVVIVKLGTNDSKKENWQFGGDFSSDLQSMVDTLKSLPSHPKIILASSIPAFKPTWTISDSILAKVISPVIRSVARRNKCLFLDLHTVSGITSGEMQPDGIHPTAEGASCIAKAVYAFMRENKIAAKRRKE